MNEIEDFTMNTVLAFYIVAYTVVYALKKLFQKIPVRFPVDKRDAELTLLL